MQNNEFWRIFTKQWVETFTTGVVDGWFFKGTVWCNRTKSKAFFAIVF